MESPSPPQERPPQDQPPLHPNKSRSVNPTLDHPLKSRAADPYVWIPASLWPRFGTTTKPDPKSKDIYPFITTHSPQTPSSGITRSKATSRETSPSGTPPIFLAFGSFSLPATLASAAGRRRNYSGTTVLSSSKSLRAALWAGGCTFCAGGNFEYGPVWPMPTQ